MESEKCGCTCGKCCCKSKSKSESADFWESIQEIAKGAKNDGFRMRVLKRADEARERNKRNKK